jgi:hypothetical protein
MGGYQAYENVFLRSKECDLGSMNGICLAIVDNISIGSKTFILGAANYVRGNRVFDTTDTQAIGFSGPPGPMVLLDNLFASKAGTTGRVVSCAISTLAVGNTFTVADWPLRPCPSPHPNAAMLQREMWKALDNDPATEYFDPSCNNPNAKPHPIYPFVLQWNGGNDTKRTVVSYTLTSGSQPNLDPRDFRLLGANYEGGPWTVLDTQTGVIFANRREKRAFPIKEPQAFSVYRLEATANAAGTPGMRVAEFELLDGQGANLTGDRSCLMTTRNEAWGDFYAIDQKIASPEALPVPATVKLPATPKNRQRKIFEVRLGMGDDAKELQTQIDAAANELPGSKPVVHVPKGSLMLKRTVTIPAGCDLQLVGDGVGNGASLNYAGGSGPVLRLEGPNRTTLRDLSISSAGLHGVDAVVIEQADQDGGRVYGSQLRASGGGGPHMVASAIRVDGLERSDVTMICGGIESCLNGVDVRGGAKSAAGGATPNQVVFLTGGSSHGCRMLHATEGGKVVGEAFWYEGDWDYPASLIDQPATTSGQVSAAAMRWGMDASKQAAPTPMVSVDGFDGQCTIVGSDLYDPNNRFIRLKGDGARTLVLCAGTQFTGGGQSPKVDSAWVDQTEPDAKAAMLGCNSANCVMKDAKRMPDADLVRRGLALLRAVRIDPPMDLPKGVTDVKLFRISIEGGDGKDGIRVEMGKG